MKFLTLFNLVALVCASHSPKAIDTSTVYPNLRKFEDRNKLADSAFWSRLILDGNKGTAENNAIYLEDTRTILVVNEKNLYLPSRLSLFKKPTLDILLIEVDLGSEARSLGSNFFPLATASAEYSSSSVIIEREVSRSRTITFNPSILLALTLAKNGIGLSLDLAENHYRFNKETITCTANPGDRVQLQVTNAMIQFPQARTRVVKYKRKNRSWSDEPWAAVESHVSDETHIGALFYENFRLGRHRCVTNVSHFEDSSRRKWIEWSAPWSL